MQRVLRFGSKYAIAAPSGGIQVSASAGGPRKEKNGFPPETGREAVDIGAGTQP